MRIAIKTHYNEPTLLEDVALLTPGLDIGRIIINGVVQLQVQAQLIVGQIAGRDGDLGIGHGQIHAHIVSAHIVLNGIQEAVAGAGPCLANGGHFLAIAAHLQIGQLQETYQL